MRVLVPIAILESETVPLGLANLLSTMDVTVLGYHVLPEQTPPDQARGQYEERATSALADIAEEFRRAGGDADHRLVFTHDRRQTIDRVANDVGATAYAITGATSGVDSVLVPLTGDVDVDRIVDFVAALVDDRAIDVTLFRAASGDADVDAAREMLDAAADRLRAHDVTVDVALATNENPSDALIDASPSHDAIVVGERAPSLQSLVFGDEPRRLAAESVGPVLVVRRDERSDAEAETDPDDADPHAN